LQEEVSIDGQLCGQTFDNARSADVSCRVLYGPEIIAECSPMFLQRLLAWIRMKRRGSTQYQDETGVVISTRLKELLQVKNPEPVETTSTESPSEGDENQLNREKFGT
jgi:hypothetical protein